MGQGLTQGPDSLIRPSPAVDDWASFENMTAGKSPPVDCKCPWGWYPRPTPSKEVLHGQRCKRRQPTLADRSLIQLSGCRVRIHRKLSDIEWRNSRPVREVYWSRIHSARSPGVGVVEMTQGYPQQRRSNPASLKAMVRPSLSLHQRLGEKESNQRSFSLLLQNLIKGYNISVLHALVVHIDLPIQKAHLTLDKCSVRHV